MQQADTRAAPRADDDAQAHADRAEAALAVCLQQPAFREPDGRASIKLLRVSKRLAALVARCCAGALALHMHVTRPEQAGALAAWLPRHGGLLAELDLYTDICGNWRVWRAAAEQAQYSQQQHPAARVLEQLPSNLVRLHLRAWVPDDIAAQQAAVLARALSRQLMQQLRSLELPDSWSGQAATVLPALAGLSQLTSLSMWADCDAHSPVQHLPAQLQQLELNGWDCSTSDLPWLALEHVTGLTSLCMSGARVDGGVLPRGLRSLAVWSVSSMVPLQQLQQLSVLQIEACTTSAEQLRQLSTLARLEQLSVSLWQDQLCDAAATLGVLPLTHLSLYDKPTAACLDHLGKCTRLTSVELSDSDLAPDATLEQLAGALARLTALERVMMLARHGRDDRGEGESMPPAPAHDGWAAVCAALSRLPCLTSCQLFKCVAPAAVALEPLASATQLTDLCVAL